MDVIKNLDAAGNVSADWVRTMADMEHEQPAEACGTFDKDCVFQLLSLVTQSSLIARATGDADTLAINARCLRVLNRMAGELTSKVQP